MKLNEDAFLQTTSDRANAMRLHIKTGTVVAADLSKEANRKQSWSLWRRVDRFSGKTEA